MDDQTQFSALSNPTRRTILGWMKDVPGSFGEIGGGEAGEVCVSAVQAKTGLSQSTVSAYMAVLERAGLITSKRRGQWTFFKRDEAAIDAFTRKLRKEL